MKNFRVKCVDDDKSLILSFKQYKWLLSQEPYSQVFAPKGGNQRILYRGDSVELNNRLAENADAIAAVYEEDFVEYWTQNSTIPIACTNIWGFGGKPWILFIEPAHVDALVERYEEAGLGSPFTPTTYKFKGQNLDHCGNTPEGLIRTITRILKDKGEDVSDLPTWEDLPDIADPSEGESYVDRKLDELCANAELVNKLLKKVYPTHGKSLPDSVGRD